MARPHGGPYKWVIDQAGGQDGWMFTNFFFACLWTEMKSRCIKERGQYSAILIIIVYEELIIIWLSGKFSLRDTVGSPKWAR